MRPTVDEILDGVERSFRRDIQPELTSEWAQRIAASLLQAVGHVRLRLRLERELLEEEHEDLLGVLAILEDRERDDASAASSRSVSLNDEELEAATCALRAALDRAIRAGLPPDPGDARWQAVLGYSERQLNREARLIPG